MMAMRIVPALLLVLLLASTAVSGSHHHGHRHGDAALGWIAAGSECRGTIAECLASEGEEFDLGTESSRRILATNRYISYNALRRDSIPCSRRGASYYNCRPGAQANPYSRGCSAITRCRSWGWQITVMPLDLAFNYYAAIGKLSNTRCGWFVMWWWLFIYIYTVSLLMFVEFLFYYL